MTDTELKEFVEDLQGWHEGKKQSLSSVLENTEGKDKMTLDFGDNLIIKLKSKKEVDAYRMGIISALAAFGEFPVSIEEKDK